MSGIRFSYTQRVSQFSVFCGHWHILSIREKHPPMFYVRDYAKFARITPSYAGRLLSRFWREGLVEREKIQGHNHIEKWIYHADTNGELGYEDIE